MFGRWRPLPLLLGTLRKQQPVVCCFCSSISSSKKHGAPRNSSVGTDFSHSVCNVCSFASRSDFSMFQRISFEKNSPLPLVGWFCCDRFRYFFITVHVKQHSKKPEAIGGFGNVSKNLQIHKSLQNFFLRNGQSKSTLSINGGAHLRLTTSYYNRNTVCLLFSFTHGSCVRRFCDSSKKSNMYFFF